tara:strand:- start:1126 stop:2463 length:1338 start_codon:yes stop_codon:yes gene_type:complete
MQSKIAGKTDVRKWMMPKMENIKMGVPVFFKTKGKQKFDSRIFFDKKKKLNDKLKIVSLIIDPNDFFNYETGIYVQGIHGHPNNPKKGNYSQRGVGWKKNVTVHLFNNNGEVQIKTLGEVKIHGDFSRSQPQKSFSLIFNASSKEGPIEARLFNKKQKFHRLLLRTPFTSAPQGESLISDSYLANIANNLGLDAMGSEPVNVFLNGEYWGLYHLREKINEHYLKEKYSISNNSISIVKYDSESENSYRAVHGEKGDWINLINYISSNDLSKDNVYDYVCQKIDINNFIDYLIVQTFFGNKDWPGNNFKFWKSTEKDNKWRFIIYDLDATFRKDNMFAYLQSETQKGLNHPKSTVLFVQLFKNPTFQSKLRSRYFELLHTELNSTKLIQDLIRYQELLMPSVDLQVKRWGMPKSKESWKKRISKMKKYIEKRHKDYEQHLGSLIVE